MEIITDIKSVWPDNKPLFYRLSSIDAPGQGANLEDNIKLAKSLKSVGVDVIDVPYLDLEDMDGMKKEAELVRDLGFTGKGSIHPKQINILNEIFTPSKEEISKAKRIVDQFNASDTGLVVIEGKLIEKPVVFQCVWFKT